MNVDHTQFAIWYGGCHDLRTFSAAAAKKVACASSTASRNHTICGDFQLPRSEAAKAPEEGVIGAVWVRARYGGGRMCGIMKTGGEIDGESDGSRNNESESKQVWDKRSKYKSAWNRNRHTHLSISALYHSVWGFPLPALAQSSAQQINQSTNQ
jgi:hypothetical protein